jgi:2,4-dienoyl-CoA reductase-like NADH-dependent reductase (Old Yellow Enzyme family)
MFNDVEYIHIDDNGLHLRIRGEQRCLSVDNIVVCAGQESHDPWSSRLQAQNIAHTVIGARAMLTKLMQRAPSKKGPNSAENYRRQRNKMSNPHASMLQPGRIGTMELKNRIIMAPMGENYGGIDGICGERAQDYYEERAKGGTGLIIMGTAAISWPTGTSEPHQLGISNDSFIPGLAEVTRRVHSHGGKVAIQINHSGKVAANDRTHGREMWVSSIPPDGPVAEAMRTVTPKEFSTFVGVGPYPDRYRVMDKADIAQMVEWFAAAALRAKQANFDAVEVHCAHNYMIANFLSPFFNSRSDEYGGSYENRSRLLREVLTAVRERVGADFPSGCVSTPKKCTRPAASPWTRHSRPPSSAKSWAWMPSMSRPMRACPQARPSRMHRFRKSRMPTANLPPASKRPSAFPSSRPAAGSWMPPPPPSAMARLTLWPWAASCWPTPTWPTNCKPTPPRACAPAFIAMPA